MAHEAELPRLGIHDGVNEGRYHADSRSISSSQAKTLLYSGPAVLHNAVPEHHDAFDMGSVVHALILGVGEYEVLDFDSWRTKEARAARDAVRATGAAPIIPRDLAKAEAMRDSVLAHPVAARILQRGRPEVSLWATDPATGVLMRGRIDWLRDGSNIDVKTSSGRTDAESFTDTVMRFNYAIQIGWYSKLLTLNGIEPEDPMWIAVSKRPPYEAAVLKPSADLIEFSMGEVDRALALYARCLETDEWPELQHDNAPDYIAHAQTVQAVPIEEVVPF